MEKVILEISGQKNRVVLSAFFSSDNQSKGYLLVQNSIGITVKKVSYSQNVIINIYCWAS